LFLVRDVCAVAGGGVKEVGIGLENGAHQEKMVSQKVQIRRRSKKLQIQGAQTLRNEAYLWYAAVTKDAAQRRSWTFYEAVKKTGLQANITL
jgi:hypothetical protein